MDGLLAFKLVFAPIVVAIATWLSRRLGIKVGGWIVALPLISGPISIFFVLQHGPDFAAQAAIGTLAGSASTCLFCLVYGLSARRGSWPLSLSLALLTFIASTLVLKWLNLGVWPTLIVVVTVYGLARYFMPKPLAATVKTAPPWWDIPLRMVLAAAFILIITGLSSNLGPELSGLLSPIPLLITLLTVFAHHFQGSDGAIRTLRGTLTGTLAFALFFLMVTLTVTQWPLVVTYLVASVVSVTANTVMQMLTD
jgi:hypothetical protein